MIQLTYKVIKPHNTGEPPFLQTELLKDVVDFLKRQENPDNFDIKVEMFDGYGWEFETYTGYDILAGYDKIKETKPIKIK
jgi:hypothetical protein